MQFKFKNLVVKPSLMEEIYVKSQAFRNIYDFNMIYRSHQVPDPLMIAHDWLHLELNIPPTEAGEKLLVTAEMHLYDPQQFETDATVPQHLYEQYQYMDKHQEELIAIHNFLN